MSILPRVAGAIFAAFALTACQPGATLGPRPVAAVLDGSFNLSPPPGFCVDRAASHEDGDRAVYVMGRCSDASDAAPAVVTLSLGERGSAAVLGEGGQAMAAWFTSARGRAALARSGRAGDLAILTAFQRGPAFQMRVADRQAGTSWRAVTGISGRLVSVMVAAASGAVTDRPGGDGEAGRKLLESAIDALLRANRAPAATP